MKLPTINTNTIETLVKTGLENAREASPALLIAAGTIGLVTGAVMAWKASRKVDDEIEVAKQDKADEIEKEVEEVELTPAETAKAVWKTVVPVAAIEIISVGCIIGGYTIKRHRMDAVVTAATLSASQLKLYQEKALETVGPKKEKEIKAAVSKEQLDKKFESNLSDDDIIVTGRGTQLFFEPTQNCLFYSDREFIQKCFNNLNMRMINEMYITLNELYSELGLPSTSIGDDLGWTVEDGQFEPSFDAIFTRDGRTCACIDYIPKGPTYDFRRRYA
ncbi:MAG: DUF6353 family protein [Clostridiales bacterium]|nr:DUF6353 family protein [Clostridiales bacterium]